MQRRSAKLVLKYVTPVQRNVKNMPSMEWSIAENVLKHAEDVRKNAAQWLELTLKTSRSPC
jgi:hypothetical protein